MARPLAILLLLALTAGAARAQGFSGNIFSGVPSGFSSGFNGSIPSGLGAPGGSGRAVLDDVTLGGTGEFRPGFLRGQPSNYPLSYGALNAVAPQTLDVQRGPAEPLDFTNGPAGPLD